jgi:hypothetical protein
MSLSDIYNPKEGYDRMELADLQGTQLELVNPKSTSHCRFIIPKKDMTVWN